MIATLLVVSAVLGAGDATDDEIAGEVPVLKWRPEIGVIGRLDKDWKFESVDGKEAMIRMEVFSAHFGFNGLVQQTHVRQMYCKGFDFSKMLVGDPFPSNLIVKVSGTHRGVLLLEPSSIEGYRELATKERERLAKEAEEKQLALAELARLAKEKEITEALEAKRTWKDKTGSYSVVAAYWGYEPGFVILLKEDRSKVKVSLSQLSEDDRKFAVRTARDQGDLGD